MVQVILGRVGSALVALVAGWLWLFTASANAATITLYGTQTNQIIDGFGANINSWAWNTNEARPLMDALIDEAGMTIFRVVLQNGWETTNDNTNPAIMNWAYYNAIYSTPAFERLWDFMAYLNQKGITDGLMLNPQGIGPAWLGGQTLTAGKEDEWAEMVASLLVYARGNRHLQFTQVAPNNEPDYGEQGIVISSAAQYVTTLRKLAQLLDTNGLSDLRLIGPDRATGNTAWMPEMLNDPVVMAKLAHFGVHSYSGAGSGSIGVYNLINGSAYPDRRFWVTEFNMWCASCIGTNGNDADSWAYSRGTAQYLFDHLAIGASAGIVWEGFDSYYPHDGFWDFFGLFRVNNTNATPLTFTRRKNFYTLAQVTKFVRPGAQRINLGGSTSPFTLLAFYHRDRGQFTLTGINPSGATALTGTLTSLPTIPSLEFYYTSSTTNLAHTATVPVSNGVFSLTIPGDSVFTLTGFDPAKISAALAITASTNAASNSITLSWPAAATGFALETTTNLTLPGIWSPVTNIPQLLSNQQCIFLNPTGQSVFFRLHRP